MCNSIKRQILIAIELLFQAQILEFDLSIWMEHLVNFSGLYFGLRFMFHSGFKMGNKIDWNSFWRMGHFWWKYILLFGNFSRRILYSWYEIGRSKSSENSHWCLDPVLFHHGPSLFWNFAFLFDYSFLWKTHSYSSRGKNNAILTNYDLFDVNFVLFI